MRGKAVTAQDGESCLDPFALSCFVDAGEFTIAMQSKDGFAAAFTEVPIAVHGDGSAIRLKSAHSIPELGISIVDLQFGVLIIGDYGENRPQRVTGNDREKALPSFS